MNKKTTTLANPHELTQNICHIAEQIAQKNPTNQPLILIGLHTCGVPLAQRIGQYLKNKGLPIQYGQLDIGLYRDDLHKLPSPLTIRNTTLDFPIDGHNIILCDDVIHTGRTARAALNALLDYGRPASIQLAVLVDRTGRQLPIQPDYTAHRLTLNKNQKIRISIKPLHTTDGIYSETTTP